MQEPRLSAAVHAAKLSAAMRANLAVEEAFVAALSDMLRVHHEAMDMEEAAMLADLIRRHRVGLIKQRAVLGALDIHV